MSVLKNLRLFMYWSTIIISFSVSPAHAVITTDLNLSDTNVQVGQTFTMNVVINDVFGELDPFEEVLAFGFDVSIENSALVSFGDASIASPFDDDSAFFS